MITQTIETITPELAEDILSRKAINRPISYDAVKRYADVMAAKKWLVGPPLMFNGDGTGWGGLIDGQHRVAAVRQSGMPTQFAVIRGLDNTLFKHVDVGKPRTARDLIALLGIKAPGIVAVIARVVKHVESGGEAFETYTGMLPAEIADRAADETLYGIAADLYGKYTEARKLLKSLSLPGYMLYEARSRNSAAMELFFEKLSGTTVSDSATDPAFVLRNRLTADALSKRRMSGKERAAIAIKAWNATARGEQIQRLKIGRKEDFPKMVF